MIIKNKLPKDFDWKFYLEYHPDLQRVFSTQTQAIRHYLFYGINENRKYKKPEVVENIKKTQTPEFWNNNYNLLYFSPQAPDYDLSSGGNRLLQILKIIKELNYNVHFMCNSYVKPHHKTIVEDLGITVHIPDIKNKIYLNKNLEELKKQGIIFGSCIFSWYDIADQYVKFVKEFYPNIKIIIDSVDVHWIREKRGIENQHLVMSNDLYEQKKIIEKNIYSEANVVFAVTENDKKYIQEEIGYHNNIKIISNIHQEQNISLGNDIFFIGNYCHTPNIDAACNCIDIYKKFKNTDIYKKLEIKPKLYIAGPNVDKKIVSKVDDKNIIITGHVEELSDLYKKCCLLLSPLTWGAGIKGKICDAGMAGIPSLTSKIGNEGIDFSHRINSLVCDNFDNFVEELQYFFSLSYEQKEKMGILCKNHLKKLVSVFSAKNILQRTLQDKHVIISIVTYNQPEKLNNCLNSLLKLTKYNNYTIAVSDNSSDKFVYNIVKKYTLEYPNKIRYIKNSTNKYFIDPNNQIINDPEYSNSDVVLVNDDIEFIDCYWLNYLYSSAYSSNNIAAAGGKTIFPDGKLAEAGAELFKDGKGRNKGRNENPDDIKYNIPHYTGYCSGCLLYMRRDAIEKVGCFSKELEFLYYEDSEWQYRSHIFGLKTIYDPRCVAIHFEGSSAGTDINVGYKKYQETNRIKFINIMKKLGCDDVSIYN